MSNFFNPSETKPIPWLVEPQFTSAPELWRHIIALETFDYPNPNKNLSGELSSYVGSPALDVTKRGRGLSVNGNNNYYSFGRSLVSGTEYTYLLVTRLDDLQSTKRNFSCGQHNVGSTGYDMGGPYFGSGFNVFFYPVTGSNVGGSRVYSNGDLVAFVCRYRSGETNGTQIWADGKLDGQGTVSGTTGTTYDFVIGAKWNTVGVSHTPIFFAAFDAALDSSQCKALSEDPFSLIRPSNDILSVADEAITGSGSHQAQNATYSSAGEIEKTGTSSHSAQTATHSATGERELTGSASHTANTATHAASGSVGVSGSGSHQAQNATHSATGVIEITGTSTHQAQAATHSASGLRELTGSGSHSAQTSTHTASGSISGSISGSGSHQAQSSTHSATGERELTGSASHSAQASTHVATGEREITGSASHTAETATHAGSGTVGNVVSGSGSHTAQSATHSASGLRKITGSGVNLSNTVEHTGLGKRTVTGSSSHTAQSATHAASGSVTVVVTGSGSHQAQRATHVATSAPGLPTPIRNKRIVDISAKYSITDVSSINKIEVL